MIPKHVAYFGTRPAPRVDPEPHWKPVRFVATDQTCSFCGDRIPRGKPGTRTGERGTKAWWNEVLRVWECLVCREAVPR